MKKPNYYQKYLALIIAFFEELIKEYHAKISNTRDNYKGEIHGDLRNELTDKFQKAQHALLARHTFLRDVLYEYKKNRFKKYDEIFDEAMEKIPATDKEDFLKKLATYTAFDDCYYYLRLWDTVYKGNDENTPNEEDENETEPLNHAEKRNKAFTGKRQALAIHYLLNYIGVKGIDNTEKARFAQFLTGNESGNPHIKNTNIYKYMSYPLHGNEKSVLKDLKFVRGYFELLNIDGLLHEINKDIKTS